MAYSKTKTARSKAPQSKAATARSKAPQSKARGNAVNSAYPMKKKYK